MAPEQRDWQNRVVPHRQSDPMFQDKMPMIVAGVFTVGLIVALGWSLMMPDAPPPPSAVTGEPWRDAKLLAGTWALTREQPYQENDCKGVERSVYELSLDKMQDYTVTGRMTMRFSRQPSGGKPGACPAGARSGEYDATVGKDGFGQLEITLVARSCDDGGQKCPLVDLKGNIRQAPDALIFGGDRLVKVKK